MKLSEDRKYCKVCGFGIERTILSISHHPDEGDDQYEYFHPGCYLPHKSSLIRPGMEKILKRYARVDNAKPISQLNFNKAQDMMPNEDYEFIVMVGGFPRPQLYAGWLNLTRDIVQMTNPRSKDRIVMSTQAFKNKNMLWLQIDLQEHDE